MAEEELATVELFRFDPEVDAAPRYDKFKVPYKGRSVLDVLLHIYYNLDNTFAFRWACTKGFCRCCIVSVNGQPVLACRKSAEANMRLSPHPKFKVLKDLLVDLSRAK